jgi:hypothetical protein
MTREQKLERWAEREITRNINHIILERPDGSILAFGQYEICPMGRGVTVSRNSQGLGNFTDRKTALTWCVARHRKMLNFSTHIRVLDQRYRGLLDDVQTMQLNYRRCRDPDRRDTLLAKVHHKQWHLQMLQDELEKCAIKAKYLQLRGFEK